MHRGERDTDATPCRVSRPPEGTPSQGDGREGEGGGGLWREWRGRKKGGYLTDILRRSPRVSIVLVVRREM